MLDMQVEDLPQGHSVVRLEEMQVLLQRQHNAEFSFRCPSFHPYFINRSDAGLFTDDVQWFKGGSLKADIDFGRGGSLCMCFVLDV